MRKNLPGTAMNMRTRLCRIGSVALVCIFLFCAFFAHTAYAEDIEGSFPYDTSGLSGKVESSEYEFVYRDSFFEGTAYQLNMELARMAMRFAIAGFGVGENSDASRLLALFDRLGIRYEDTTVHYEMPGPDTIGYAYGVREITDDELLIVAVVRGRNYQKEWAGNFTLGLSMDHEGFRSCADIVVKDLADYMQAIPQGKKVSLLLTGYSRGAAVSNLAAAELDKMAAEGSLGPAKPDNLYTYCFACPLATMKSDETSKELYGNIVSFVHPADPVPKVAPGEWGYARYGTTYLLPTPIHYDDYDTYYETFLERFCSYSLAEDFPIDSGRIVSMDQAIELMANTLMSPAVFVLTVQDKLRSAFLGGENGISVVSSLMGSAVGGGAGDGKLTLDNPFVAHAPELYLSALDAAGDGALLRNVRTEYGYLVCEAENSVCVYDSSGREVVSGDGEACEFASENTDVGALYQSKGTFLFDFSATERYYAVIPANGELKVTVQCGRFDSLASREAKTSEYKKVSLKEQESIVLVLDADNPLMYRTTIGAEKSLIESLIKGETAGAEQVKPSKVTEAGKETEKTPEDETPTPAPTATVAPSDTAKSDGDEAKSDNGTPKWIIPAAGAAGVLVIAVLVLLLGKRRKNRGESGTV